MKPFVSSLLITVVLAAGVLMSSRPPKVVKTAPTAIPSAPATVAATPALVIAPMPAETLPAAPARLPVEVELARALRSGSVADRDRAFNVLLPELVARDPSMAGHFVLAWPPGALRDEMLGHFIRLWAATDIGGVVTWMTSLLDEADRVNAAQAATAQVAQDDTAGAIELAQLLRVGVDDGSLEHRVQLWTAEKPAEALAWIVRRPADSVRDRLLARMAWTRAQSDPVEAAGLVLNHMTPGETRDAALLAVVRQWAVRDPAPATAWVAQFPDGSLHTRAVDELVTASRLR